MTKHWYVGTHQLEQVVPPVVVVMVVVAVVDNPVVVAVDDGNRLGSFCSCL